MSFSNKLFMSRGIILELLRDRGVDTSEYENYTQNEIDIMFKNVSVKSRDLNTLDIKLRDSNGNNVIVKYLLTSKIRFSNMINNTETLIEDEIINDKDTVIFIIKDKLSSDETLEEYFKSIYDKKQIFCQYFWINSLTLNITKHEKVPKHIILNNSEKEDLVKKCQINSLDKLQYIKKTDPVAKYYGMKEGDICKIIRSSESAGLYINYRLCQN